MRSQKGQEILEGAVAMILVIGGWVMGGLLVMDCAAIGYYQNKLATVTQQGAQFAVAHFYDPPGLLSVETQQYVQYLMGQNAIPMDSTFNVKLTEEMVGNFSKGSWQIAQTVNVHTTVPLFGSLRSLPMNITLNDTETCLLSEYPAAYAYFPAGTTYNATVDVVVPVKFVGFWAGQPQPPMVTMDALKGVGQINGKPLLTTDGACWFDGGFIINSYGPGNQLSGYKGISNSILP